MSVMHSWVHFQMMYISIIYQFKSKLCSVGCKEKRKHIAKSINHISAIHIKDEGVMRRVTSS